MLDFAGLNLFLFTYCFFFCFQFYFTLRDDIDYLDGKNTVFGEVAEGLDTLERINEAYVDNNHRPFKNIRIKHTYILDDPFVDPPQLAELIPDASPEGKPKDEIEDVVRLEDDWVPMDEQLSAAELEEVLRAKEAHSSAVVLESIGDIPEAEIKPPENVLFVCKLNPVTEDVDLNTIFSRFGNVVSAEVIRDFKTGDSLCYAFIEFETIEACEQAYFKMDNALIDDRRIHVDFSQSVSKLWSQYKRKDNQAGKGKGCFKCGALDHIAKECSGGPSTTMKPPKYVLKEENIQMGGNGNSRYEMVFDGDTPLSSQRGKKHQEPEREERREKRRMDNHSTDDVKQKEREKRDSTHEKFPHDEIRRGHREDPRRHGSRLSESRREEYQGDRAARDKEKHKRHIHGEERDKKGSRKSDSHIEKRDVREYRRHDNHRERSDERDYKRSAYNDSDERQEHGSRKRSAHSDHSFDRRYRDEKKR
ncbi:hypothetical protein AQUCO_00201392v1 [Aquilegia coerulea]|uniref:Peptidyl-prolyl cis-trans isomerase n=1 Tax=Aquilegia coerulea TaxID=218851 RepID=A0A2G5F7V3_AQUCA|nr:hypothetical protein AQUCO_00201392v1 [Aquilegia coerulea]